jgi:hypothetical protein
MNIKEIEDLLERYYEGETTLPEENRLKDFFLQDDVPEHLKLHQPIFRFFTEEAGMTLPDEKEEESLMRRIEQYKAEASGAHAHPGKRKLYYLTGIAAGLFLLISLVFVVRNEITHKPSGSLKNPGPEVAYIQTRQAILMVSVGLNTGIDAVQRLNTLDNAVEQIQLVNKFFNYKNQFMNPDAMMNLSTKQ